MDAVADVEVEWIRHDSPTGPSIRSAHSTRFNVYGLLNIDTSNRPTENELLSTLAPRMDERLIAGWILRNDLITEPGGEHLLKAD